jgi:polyribonucleotide nucleotidyltransferase
MIEGFAREMSEADMFEAIALRASAIKEVICACSANCTRRSASTKATYVPPPDDGLDANLKNRFYDELKAPRPGTTWSSGSCAT